ncbi:MULTISPECIES: hypothetical protein [unclassified Duganella]|uniref:hypothetical protein n=1 Tax=unclassified Duganella TaxID=2636909 RepID=UPI000886F64C|nr:MULTISPECIES: hypothetical protein [unclassified Duganella]SDH05127.1 hypothetical protein SAMN05216320_109115 [Duganella sp. OV458]SDK21038.1 hypothetical protein SAMN05428973_109167 [Duganella sp. OV510]
MKTIVIAIAALAALTGCATQRPAYYSAAPRVQDPYQWHTVEVMPAGSQMRSGTWTEEVPQQPQSRVVYTTEPAYTTSTTTYVSSPVYYQPAPVYYQSAPVYYAPTPSYYYPPVALSLGFSFNRWCCGSRWGGRGGYRHR